MSPQVAPAIAPETPGVSDNGLKLSSMSMNAVT